MSANGWLQFAIYSVILLITVRPVGIYMTRVLEGERTWLDPVFRPFERLIYKLCAVKADKEMNWREYAFALLGFSAVTMVLTYAIRAFAVLPALEPAAFDRGGAPILPSTPPPASPRIQTGSSTRPSRP